MKKLILIILLLTLTLNANAAHVSPEKAKKAALNWFNHAKTQAVNPPQNQHNRKRTRNTHEIKDVYVQQKDETDTYYIINMNPTGFVVVAADDAVDPILAYSFESSMDPENINPGAQERLDSYSTQISDAISNTLETGEKIGTWSTMTSDTFNIETAALDVPAMPPLISTKWGLYTYYNTFVPKRLSTGEHATAMAQVLKYWNYPVHGIGEHSYTPRCIPELGVQYADFQNTQYEWSKMPEQLSASSSPDEISAVAKLIYHCGVSVDMNYLYIDSSASIFTVMDALIKNFDYSKSLMKLRYKSDYTDEEWNNMLINNLNNHRVLIYQSCHKFICDGYQGTDYFHFNWCKDGESDGYYKLDNLNPFAYGYTGGHMAIFGIQPDKIYNQHPMLSETFENSSLSDGWTVTIVNDGVPSPQWTTCNIGANPVCNPYSGTGMITFNSNDSPSGAEARLVLPDVDLTTTSNAKLIFYMYHDSSQTAQMTEGVNLQISEDGTNWKTINFFPRYTLSTGWHEYRVDLSYYEGKSIKIGFLGHSDAGSNIYIDNVTIEYPIPSSFFYANDHIFYIGAPVIFTDHSYRATSWEWDFGDGETSVLQNPTHAYASAGSYTVTLSINNGYSVNIKKNYIHVLQKLTTPYTLTDGGNFENYTQQFLSQALSGDYNLWEVGQPSNEITDTTSGTNVWKTDLDADIVEEEDYVCALYSPMFDFSTTGTYFLKFNYRMEVYRQPDLRTGSAWMEVSTDRGLTWKKLGSYTGNPQGTENWYNMSSNDISSTPVWWHTVDSYTQAIYNATEFNGQQNVSFRFIYKILTLHNFIATGSVDGWAIDDFEITFEPPTARFTVDKPIQYLGFPVKFTDQSTFPVSWFWDLGDGTTSTSQNITHTYNAPGQYTVTLSINNGDSVETKVKYIHILPKIKLPYTLADGGNFESNFFHFASQILSGDMKLWELGQPANAINDTASGSNVWKTDLDADLTIGNYTNTLLTPMFDFTDQGYYYLKFKYRMEKYFNNGPGAAWLEYSLDGGITWQKLGSDTGNPDGTENWYNSIENTVTSNAPCWWQTTNSYTQAIYNASEFVGKSEVAFRFVFKVKDTYHVSSYEIDGLSIDDFQIEFYPETIDFTSNTQISHMLVRQFIMKTNQYL